MTVQPLRRGLGRGWLIGAMAALLALLGGSLVEALTISDAWASPRSRERPRRSTTLYIILHTTEGGSAGALRKLQRRGEAHYLVDETGGVFRIVNRRRVAYHCGRSMWDGRTNLDEVSIGIEVAGYHYRALSAAQVRSLAALLRELQRIYRIPDERVLTHSMVAYGAPNRWHRQNHRGRKRCGMQFACPNLRRRLGLHAQPLFDPDVRAGRLISADPELAAALYGSAQASRSPSFAAGASGPLTVTAGRTAWDIARERYDHPDTFYIFPDNRKRRGNEITDWAALPPGTRILLGYQVGGPLGPRRRAFDISGARWNAPDTFYLFPDGRLVPGDAIDERRIPDGAHVLYRAPGAS